MTGFAVVKRFCESALLSGKMRLTEVLYGNSVVMLKLSVKFNAPESVVPAKAGTQ